MLDNASEIIPSQKTINSPYKDRILSVMKTENIFGKTPTEKKARNKVATELKKIRKDPLFELERKGRINALRSNIIDGLTGLYNKKFLIGNSETNPQQKGILEREVEAILKNKRNHKTYAGFRNELTIAMLDIDHFKNVNDTYGHPVGDEILKMVAQTILTNIRSGLGDFGIRYGGEEFMIITPNGLEVAQQMIERIRNKIEKMQFDKEGYPKKITISAGLTNLTERGSGGSAKIISDALISRADGALYNSKDKGRNQTTVAVRGEDGKIEYKKGQGEPPPPVVSKKSALQEVEEILNEIKPVEETDAEKKMREEKERVLRGGHF